MPFDPESLAAQDEQLRAILENPNLDETTKKAAREVEGYRKKIIDSGVEPVDPTPRESVWSKIFNTLALGQRAVEGAVDTVVNRPEILRGGFYGGLLQGAKRGIDEQISGSDILRRAGVQNPYVRGIAGFAGDVLLDPVSWLSLGVGKGAAMAGGIALTKKGEAVANAIKAPFAGQAFSVGDNAADETFKAVGRYYRNSEKVAKAADDGEMATSLAMQLGLDAEKIQSAGIALEDVKSLVEPKKLALGINLPFLGHFQTTEKAIKEISKDPGIVGIAMNGWRKQHPIRSAIGQGLRVAGDAINPGKLSLFETEVPEALLTAVDGIRKYSHESLGRLASVSSKALDQIPIAGPITKEALKQTGEVVGAAAKSFNRTFNRAFFYGPDFRSAEIERQAAIAFAKTGSQRKAVEHFGEAMSDPLVKPMLEEAVIDLDAMVMNPVEKLFEKGGAMEGRGGEYFKLVKQARDGTLDDAKAASFLNEVERLSKTDENLTNGMAKYMQDPSVPLAKKAAVQKMVDLFGELIKEERASGLEVGFLANYIPHRYNAINKGVSTFGGKTASSANAKAAFQKGRVYATLSDAFKDKGLVGSTNIMELYQSRLENSLKLRANRAFAHRVILENGIPKEVLQKLAQEAQADPVGGAAQLLRKRGFDVPTGLTPEELMQGQKIVRQQAELKSRHAAMDAPDYQGKTIDLAPPTDEAREATIDFSNHIDESLFAQGIEPLSSSQFKAIKGELGRGVEIDGKAYFLPNELADAVGETLAGKDYARGLFKDGSIGQKFIDLSDASVRWFKKFNTLPWPSYWTGNVVGDGLFRFMDGGINAMEPGVMGRLFKVLNGEATFTNKAGGVINKKTLEDAFEKGGLSYSISELLNFIDAANATDVEKYMKIGKNSIVKNLTTPGDRTLALSQAANFMRDNFETNMRATHVFHRLEQGDTIQSAIKRANEAMINYRDMTPWEQSISRRVFPFYTWLSKATKKQLTSLMTSPGDISIQLKSARALSEFFSSPDAMPTADEFDMKLLNNVLTNEQIAVPLGRDAKGKTITARVNALPINTLLSTISLQAPRSFTIGEITDAMADSGGRTLQKAFAASNPLIKAAAEKFTGKNLYFDKPLDSKFLRQVPSIAESVRRLAPFPYDAIPTHILDGIDDIFTKGFLKGVPDGKGNYIVDQGRFWALMQIPGLSRLVSSTRNLPNTDVPLAQSLLPMIAPIKVSPSNPEATYLSELRAALQKQYQGDSIKQRLDNAKVAA